MEGARLPGKQRFSGDLHTVNKFLLLSQRPTPTHEGDELVLELGVQAGDHHLHGVADLAHALVLGAAHGLHVPLLQGPQETGTKTFPQLHLPLSHTWASLSQIPEMLKWS